MGRSSIFRKKNDGLDDESMNSGGAFASVPASIRRSILADDVALQKDCEGTDKSSAQYLHLVETSLSGGSFWDAFVHRAVQGGAARGDDKYRLFVPGTSRVFEPRSHQLISWLVFVLLTSLYTSIETPVEIAWFSEASKYATNRYFLGSGIYVTVVFALDILVNFNLAFVEHTGRGLVSTRAEIAKQYAKLWLWLDLLSTLPFDLMVSTNNLQAQRLLKMMRLFRVFKLLQTNRLVRVIESRWAVDYNACNLVMLSFSVLLIAHIMGCLLFVVASAGLNRHEFLVSNDIQTFDTFQQYVYGFYWASMTVSTIGYGDVSITSTGLRIYAIFAMLVGASVYAYAVGSLVQVVQNMGQRENERRQRLSELNAITHEAALPGASRRKLRAFFSKTGMGKSVLLQEHQECLQRMSPPMAAAFVRHIFSDWMPYVGWLQSDDHSFIRSFSVILREQGFAPKEAVVQRKDAAVTLYLIKSGTVMLLGRGYLFANGRGIGEEILLSQRMNYGYDVWSASYLDCWCIDRDEFHELISRYPLVQRRVRWAALAVAVKRTDMMARLESMLHQGEGEEGFFKLNGHAKRRKQSLFPTVPPSQLAPPAEVTSLTDALPAGQTATEMAPAATAATAAAQGQSEVDAALERLRALEETLRRSLQEAEAVLGGRASHP